ncbi:hypothetical protein RJ641_019242 [Dillenia turbinata]|uniref:Uncharacterized protein n=1 Tax=Dillenia turbinata TaxID=194707 RepID=A0AAN8UUZ8_9MAGN
MQTDTASVLHEAMGYIRFLHDQVQLLCSPYLQHLPSSPHHLFSSDCGSNEWEEPSQDLRSRGLCLVPVACTAHVGNNNGADFWSPATMNNNISTEDMQLHDVENFSVRSMRRLRVLLIRRKEFFGMDLLFLLARFVIILIFDFYFRLFSFNNLLDYGNLENCSWWLLQKRAHPGPIRFGPGRAWA